MQAKARGAILVHTVGLKKRQAFIEPKETGLYRRATYYGTLLANFRTLFLRIRGYPLIWQPAWGQAKHF